MGNFVSWPMALVRYTVCKIRHLRAASVTAGSRGTCLLVLLNAVDGAINVLLRLFGHDCRSWWHPVSCYEFPSNVFLSELRCLRCARASLLCTHVSRYGVRCSVFQFHSHGDTYSYCIPPRAAADADAGYWFKPQSGTNLHLNLKPQDKATTSDPSRAQHRKGRTFGYGTSGPSWSKRQQPHRAAEKKAASRQQFHQQQPLECVARCLGQPCGAMKRDICVPDPNFKGYMELKCTERCTLQFHYSCWKQELKRKGKDSAALGAKCWTPDCEGTVFAVKAINEKNQVKVRRMIKEVADQKSRANNEPPKHQQQPKRTVQGKFEEGFKKDKNKGVRTTNDCSCEQQHGETELAKPEVGSNEELIALKREAKSAVALVVGHQKQEEDKEDRQELVVNEEQLASGAAGVSNNRALNPGEIPWEAMKLVTRISEEEQLEGGCKKKMKKGKRAKQQARKISQQLFRIELSGPNKRRPMIPAQEDTMVTGSDGRKGSNGEEAPVQIANAEPAPSPSHHDGLTDVLPVTEKTCPVEVLFEDSNLEQKLATLIKLLTDHMRVNGPTPLAKLEELAAECDSQVQVHIADEGGLKAYLNREVALEFYDDYVAMPEGDSNTCLKQTFMALWKINSTFNDHFAESLERDLGYEEYGKRGHGKRPQLEIDKAESGLSGEECRKMLVSQAGEGMDAEVQLLRAKSAGPHEAIKQGAIGKQATEGFVKKRGDELVQEVVNDCSDTLKRMNHKLDDSGKMYPVFPQQGPSTGIVEVEKLKVLATGEKKKNAENNCAAAGRKGGPGSSRLVNRIIVPLVRETGLAQEIVLGAIMAVKTRLGLLTGLTQEDLRAAVLDVLVNQGHLGADGVQAGVTLPVLCNAWNVDDLQSAPPHFSGDIITDCVICQDALTALPKDKLACGHEYHAECIKQWYHRKASCPLCNRHAVLESDYPSLN